MKEWPAKVVARHSLYGCESGCCGWSLYEYAGEREKGYLSDGPAPQEGPELVFEFAHPYDGEENDDARLAAWVRETFDVPSTTEVVLGEWRSC